MFKEEIVILLKNSRLAHVLEEILNLETFHELNFVRETAPSIEPFRGISFDSIHYLQRSLYRSSALTEGFKSSVNENNMMVAALITRAHFEISGALGFLLKKINGFYSGNIDLENLENSLHRLSFGLKLKGEAKISPDPINVMNMIDAAEELFKKISNGETMNFRIAYDMLSEYCHPNSIGMMLGIDIDEFPVIKYRTLKDKVKERDLIFILGSFHTSSLVYRMFYDITKKMILDHEEPPFKM